MAISLFSASERTHCSLAVCVHVFVLFSISAVEKAVCVRVLFNITAAETLLKKAVFNRLAT